MDGAQRMAAHPVLSELAANANELVDGMAVDFHAVRIQNQTHCTRCTLGAGSLSTNHSTETQGEMV